MQKDAFSGEDVHRPEANNRHLRGSGSLLPDLQIELTLVALRIVVSKRDSHQLFVKILLESLTSPRRPWEEQRYVCRKESRPKVTLQ